MKLPTQIGLIMILTGAAVVAAGDYLAEKPDYLTPCLQSDPAFNSCYAKNYRVLFNEWKDGVPGLKTVGSLDPQHLKRVAIAGDGNGVLSLNVELTNIVIEGFGQTIVEDASYDREKLVVTVNVNYPKLKIFADYVMKGHVLALNLDGHGKLNITSENTKMQVRSRLKHRQEYGVLFSDIEKLRVNIKDIGGFHITLENLFNGQRDLEEAADTLFNENWRDLFPFLQPSITAAFQAVIEDRTRKIFSYVPSTYFIADLV